MRHHSTAFLLSVLCLLITLTACVSTPPHAAASPSKTIKAKHSRPSLINKTWRHQYYLASPVAHHIWALQDDMLALATKKGKVRLIRTTDGKTLKTLSTPLQTISALAYDKTLLIAANQRGKVIAMVPNIDLKPKKEAIYWQTSLSGEILSPPLILTRKIIIRTLDGKVYALNRHNGDIIWSHEKIVPALSLYGTSSPVLHAGKIIVGFDDGEVVALDSRTGHALWKTNIAVSKGLNAIDRLIDIDATPATDNNTIYVSSYQTRTTALASESGRILWESKENSFRDLSLNKQGLYLVDNGNRIHALDKNSGRSRWVKNTLEDSNLTPPLLYQNLLVMGDDEGYLHVINPDDGQLLTRTRLSKSPLLFLINAQDQLIILAEDGKMTAITLDTPH